MDDHAMTRFRNILVGVDLANDDQLVADELSDATNEAIKNGLWLAKHNDAKLLFFHALEVPAYARFVPEEHTDFESSLFADSEERLASIAHQARAERVDAEHVLVVGKSWIELIRQVLRQRHDLVILGTRQRRAVTSALFGSTGLKLLRKCPCPVWITKPREGQQMNSVLVADDLSPVSEYVLELGITMTSLLQGELNVLHVLELGLARPKWDSFAIRQRARTEAGKLLKAQLASVDLASLQNPPTIDIDVDDADSAIIRKLEQGGIDLLVMGTIGRGGIAGVLTGNTAERILPHVPCSVLAVKPPDFISPVSAD